MTRNAMADLVFCGVLGGMMGVVWSVVDVDVFLDPSVVERIGA